LMSCAVRRMNSARARHWSADRNQVLRSSCRRFKPKPA
jgi:hypothetical protein